MRSAPRIDGVIARVALVALWAVLAAWPLAWILALSMPGSGGELPAEFGVPGSANIADTSASLQARTLAWHMVIALASAAVGWPVGRALATRLERGSRRLAMTTLAIALLPPWLLFSAWWTLLAPGNALHDWLALHGHGTLLRRSVLLLGCAAWGSAIASLVVAWWRRVRDRGDEELDRLEGVRGAQRLGLEWRRDRCGLFIAIVVVMAAMTGDTVCFDLAQERSIGYELRSLEAQQAPASVIVRVGAGAVAIPLALLAVGSAVGLRAAARARLGGDPLRRATGRTAMNGGDAGATTRGPRRGLVAVGPFLPALLLALLPLAMLASRLPGQRRPWDFITLHGEGASNSLGVAALAAAIGGLVAAFHAHLAIDAARSGRRGVAAWLEAVLLSAWVLVMILPSAVVSGAMAAAWHAPFGGRLLELPIVIALGESGRFGACAALVGAIAGRAWWRTVGPIESFEPSGGARPWRAVVSRSSVRAPLFVTAALAGALIVGSLAAGDVAVAARLEPPGYEWIASSILSAIHYQRPGTVTAAILATALLSFGAAWLIVVVLGRIIAPLRSRSGRAGAASRGAPAMALLVLFGAVGCDRHDGGECAPLEGATVIGGPGVVDGRFDRPRAIAIDSTRGDILVIDKTARVQRFDASGRFLSSFRMPESEQGMPVGLSIDADGSLLIPDTHYHRVITVDADGRERSRFGRYGFAPGAFVYPTDVLPLADGSLVVGEYGGSDRLQVLARDGTPIRSIGADAEFERPQSFVLSRDGRELFVVDSCNHRIQVFDPSSGRRLRILGRAGAGPGELSYPWAVSLLPDGTLLVAEQGNSRLQRLDPDDGACMGLFGGRGRDPGRLDRPWAIDLDDRRVVIADTGNGRVLSVPVESMMRTPRRRAEPR